MNAPRPLGRRRFLGGVLVALSLLLSGCVYLRLLQLKRQLADFDRNFTLVTTAGVRLNFLNPMLFADDVRWLGFEPATVRTLGQAEQWHVRWLKQPAANVREPGTFEIAFDLFFADGKLTGLSIPDHYFSVLPKEVVVSGIKSLGAANVDKKQRSIESQVRLALKDESQPWPTRATLASVLGSPTEELTADHSLTWRYHFVSADPAHRGEDIDLRFSFDPASEKLIRTHGRLPVGRIDLHFAEATDAAGATKY